jgi:hypothetical protein
VLRLRGGDGAVRLLASTAGRVEAAVDVPAEGLGGDAARVPGWTLPRAVAVAVRSYEVGEDPGDRLALARVLTAPDRLSRRLPR